MEIGALFRILLRLLLLSAPAAALLLYLGKEGLLPTLIYVQVLALMAQKDLTQLQLELYAAQFRHVVIQKRSIYRKRAHYYRECKRQTVVPHASGKICGEERHTIRPTREP